MNPKDLIALAARYGVSLLLDEAGDLVCEGDSELPPGVLGVLREHREALVAYLSTPAPPVEPSWNLDDPVVKAALAAFGDGMDDARIVKPGEPEFADVVEDWPPGKPGTEDDLHRAWLHIAVQIVNRDFAQWPVDRSTVESWRVGLHGYNDRLVALALARLDGVKPTKWGRRDHKARRLLPRKATNNTEALL